MNTSAQSTCPLDHRGLVDLALLVRESILEIIYTSGSGHAGGALSQVEILCALYGRHLSVDPSRPDWPERDRFVLSKGHGGLGLAPLLAWRGFFSTSLLERFGQPKSPLGMHMDRRSVPGVELSTGSLGHGLGVAVGMALGARLLGLPSRVICLLGDGDCYEGSTWEAAMAAPAHKLGNLVAVVDRNRMTMDGPTESALPLEPFAEKWQAFGFRVLTCDGHDLVAVNAAFEAALAPGTDRPTAVIAQTTKGKGVSFMEDRSEWHYGSLDSERYAEALVSVRASHRRQLDRLDRIEGSSG